MCHIVLAMCNKKKLEFHQHQYRCGAQKYAHLWHTPSSWKKTSRDTRVKKNQLLFLGSGYEENQSDLVPTGCLLMGTTTHNG